MKEKAFKIIQAIGQAPFEVNGSSTLDFEQSRHAAFKVAGILEMYSLQEAIRDYDFCGLTYEPEKHFVK